MNRADYALVAIAVAALLMIGVPIIASAEIQYAFAQVTNSTFTNSTSTNSTLTITNSTSTNSTSTTTTSSEPIVEEPVIIEETIPASPLPTGSISISRYTQPTDSFVNLVKTSYGSNYNLVEDYNIGEATWTSTQPRIMDGTWKNYSLKQEDQKIAIYSNAIGSIIYDLPTCSYSIYENGYNGQNIIPSVSAVATANINGVWQNLEVNDELCSVNVVEDLNGATITATKTLTETVTENNLVNGTSTTSLVNTQTFVHEIQFDVNKGIKETFKVWNVDDVELGISQTVHTGESINVGGQTIDIAQFNGQSFDRTFLEENQAQIFEIANNLNYDFDLGFESLTGLNIFFDGDYKVNLDYADGGFVNYLEIDPTFAYTDGTRYGARTATGSASSSCPSPQDTAYTNPILGSSANANNCGLGIVKWDISSIPDTATIGTVNFRYDVTAVQNSPPACDYWSIENEPSTASATTRWNDAFDGTHYVTDDTLCQTVSNDKVVDLGSSAVSNLQTDLAQDWFAISLTFDPMTRKSGDTSVTFGTTEELEVTYSIPTAPQPPTNLVATDGLPVGLSYSVPSDDGYGNSNGANLLGYKVYRADNPNAQLPLADNGGSNGGLDFTDNELLLHEPNITTQTTSDVGAIADGSTVTGMTSQTGLIGNGLYTGSGAIHGFNNQEWTLGENDKSWTYNMWFNRGGTALSGNSYLLQSYVGGNYRGGFYWYLTSTSVGGGSGLAPYLFDGTNVQLNQDSGGNDLLIPASYFNLSGWNMVTTVWDSDTNQLRQYVNNVLVFTSKVHTHTNAGIMGGSLANHSWCAFNYNCQSPTTTYAGKVTGDEWAFWDRELTTQEISDLWNSGNGALSTSVDCTELRAYYNFEQGASTFTNVAPDSCTGIQSPIDSSPNNLSIALTSGGSTTTGFIDNGISAPNLSVTSSLLPDGTDSFTVGSWVKQTATPTNTKLLSFTNSNGEIVNFNVGTTSASFTVETPSNYKIHTFTSTGSSSFQVTSGSGNVEYLVVAGGGGGGRNGGGGGGAGGLLTGTTQLSQGSYTVVVGAGGAGQTSNFVDSGFNGGNSQFNNIIATGGGGGASDGNIGVNGGSGGGASRTVGAGGGAGGSGIVGQGNDGATVNTIDAGHGGGGKGSAGQSAPNSTTGGNGGSGFSSDISGTAIVYAVGGGGGAPLGSGTKLGGTGSADGGGAGGYYSGGAFQATSGTSNRGNGGGGGHWDGNGNHNGASGGSGIVIVRYVDDGSITATGGTVTTVSVYAPTTIISATGLTDNTSDYQHYAVTRDGSSWTLYQNGQSVATATDSTDLGTVSGSHKINLDGSIDEYFIDSTALTSTEINNAYDRAGTFTFLTNPNQFTYAQVPLPDNGGADAGSTGDEVDFADNELLLHGDSLTGPDFNENFASYSDQASADASWVSADTAYTRANPTNDNLDFNLNAWTVNHGIKYDLGSPLSDSWIMDFKINWSSKAGNNSNEIFVGVSSTDSSSQTNQNSVGFALAIFSAGDYPAVLKASNGQMDPNRYGSAILGSPLSTGTDYYVRIIKDSAGNSITTKIYTQPIDENSPSANLLATRTTTNSNFSDLQYVFATNWSGAGGNGLGTSIGTIDDIKIYDGVTSVPTPTTPDNSPNTLTVTANSGTTTIGAISNAISAPNLEVTSSLLPDGTDSFTVGSWVKQTATPTNTKLFGFTNSNGDNVAFNVGTTTADFGLSTPATLVVNEDMTPTQTWNLSQAGGNAVISNGEMTYRSLRTTSNQAIGFQLPTTLDNTNGYIVRFSIEKTNENGNQGRAFIGVAPTSWTTAYANTPRGAYVSWHDSNTIHMNEIITAQGTSGGSGLGSQTLSSNTPYYFEFVFDPVGDNFIGKVFSDSGFSNQLGSASTTNADNQAPFNADYFVMWNPDWSTDGHWKEFVIDDIQICNGYTSWSNNCQVGSTTTIISATGLTDNTSNFQHYALSRDGSSWTLYQNGASVATATDSTNLGSTTGTVNSPITWDANNLDDFTLSNSDTTATSIQSDGGWRQKVKSTQLFNPSTGGGDITMDVVFPTSTTNGQRAYAYVGLDNQPWITSTVNEDSGKARYAFLLYQGALQVTEDGVSKWSRGSTALNSDILRITMDSNGIVKYYVDGSLVYTSSTTASGNYFVKTIGATEASASPLVATATYVNTVINPHTINLDGAIDEYFIDSTALSATEIQNIDARGEVAYPYTTTSLTFNDNTVVGGEDYAYRVSALNDIGESATYSNIDSAATVQPANAPTGMTATDVNNQSSLSWNQSTNLGGGTVQGYSIQKSTDDVNWTLLAQTSTTATTYTDTNVSLGNTYYYRVATVNEAGVGAYSTSASVTIADPPDPPTNLTVTPLANAVLDLSFTAPANNGGLTISGYEIERSIDGGATYSTLATNVQTTTYSDTGLNIGDTYYYRVLALNAQGASTPSGSASGVAGDVPDAVADLTAQAVPGNQILLNWSIPNENAYPLTQYDLYVSENGGAAVKTTIIPPNNTYTLINLNAGSVYDVTVTSSNQLGTSGTSNTATATSGDIPTVPTNLSATVVPGGQIDLSWNASTSPGYAVTYNLEISTDGGATWTTEATQSGTTYSDTGLTNGNTYYYRVSATNTLGTSNASTTVNAKAGDVPDAPASVSVAPLSATELSIGWTVPNDNGYTLTGYDLERSLDNTNWTSVATNLQLNTYSDSGLTQSTTYYYRVTATNALGTSAYSNSGSGQTFGVPNPVNTLALTPQSTTQIDLTWSAPSMNGYSFTEYQIERSFDGTAWNPLATTTNTFYYDQSLTANVQAYYRVAALNAYGLGATGNEPSSQTYPTAPATLTATTFSDTRIDLVWNNPAGSAHTGFKIEQSTDSGATWSVIVGNTGNVNLSYSVTGLQPVTTYDYRVSTINPSATSTPSSTATATTYGPPAAPTNLTATPQPGAQIQLDWTAPTTTNGAAVSDYQIERSTDGVNFSVLTTTGNTNITYTDTGLTTATTYYYRVAAINTYGSGSPSNVANAVASDVPSQVTGLTATALTNFEIKLDWTAPNANGYPITSYKIERSTDAGATWNVLVANTASTAVTYTDINLTSGTDYYYRVSATNNVGTGSASVSANVIAGSVPGTPSLTLTPQAGGQIDLSWTTPANNAYAIINYDVERSPDGTTWTALTTLNGNTYSDTGLIVGDTYHYRVAARNSIGLGAFSTSQSQVAGNVPGIPTLLATVASNTQINLSWSSPSANSYPITGYFIEQSADNITWTTLVANTQSTSLTYAATGLTPATDYYFRVSGINQLGNGQASASQLAHTYGPPDAMVAPTATSTTTSNTINWVAPYDNGSAITNFRVEVLTSTGSWATLSTVQSTTLTYTQNNVLSNTLYTYRVTATNAYGTSVSPIVEIHSKPIAPVLSGTTVSGTQIDLSWTTQSGVTVTYNLYKSGDGVTYSIQQSGITATTLSDAALAIGDLRYYKVSAVNVDGEGPLSSALQISTFSLPSAPQNIQITNPTPLEARVSWTLPSDNGGDTQAMTYNVERSLDNINWTLIAQPALTYYVDSGLSATTTYYYKVSATNRAGDGPYTSSVSYTTPALPGAPTNLVGTPTGSTNSAVKLEWGAGSSTQQYPLFGYQIDRRTNGGSWDTIVANTGNTLTVYTNTNLSGGNTYEYRVYSISAVGVSATSTNIVSVQMLDIDLNLTGQALTGNTVELTSSVVVNGGNPLPDIVQIAVYQNNARIDLDSVTLTLQNQALQTYYAYPTTTSDFYMTITLANGYTVKSNTIPLTPTAPFSGELSFEEYRDPLYEESTLELTVQPFQSDVIVRYQPQNLNEPAILRGFTSAGTQTLNIDLIGQQGDPTYNPDASETDYYGSVYVNPSFDYTINPDGSVTNNCDPSSTLCDPEDVPNGTPAVISFKSFKSPDATQQLGIEPMGNLFGVNMIFLFVVAIAGIFTGRSAPMGVIFILAILGIMTYLGYLDFSSPDATWALLVIAALAGIFVGKRWS